MTPLSYDTLHLHGFTNFPEDADLGEEEYKVMALPDNRGQITAYPDGSFYVSDWYSPSHYGAKADVRSYSDLKLLYMVLCGKPLRL